MTEKLLLDVNEVASLLGCGRTYVYGMIQRGELPVVKLGRLTKVPRLAVDEYVDVARFPQSSVQQAAVPASWPTTSLGPRR
ncbi:MAG: helix-turn-helix domain-containing protein [Candidatus Dormibacteria bacterium]